MSLVLYPFSRGGARTNTWSTGQKRLFNQREAPFSLPASVLSGMESRDVARAASPNDLDRAHRTSIGLRDVVDTAVFPFLLTIAVARIAHCATISFTHVF